MTKHKEFRERVEAVYRVREDSKHDHGALMWFTREIGVAYSTIQRWVSGTTDVPTYAWALLREMEQNELITKGAK